MKYLLNLLFISSIYACSAKPYVVTPPVESHIVKDNRIYVLSHGWHTGIVIPAQDIGKRIPELKLRFPDARYIEFGWGDKGFYQANEITSGLTLRAIFWPTESVIHAVAVPKSPYTYFPGSQVEKICLNKHEYSSILIFIENSFLRSDSGGVISLKNGIYGDSQFYKAEGDYYLMNTCNKWTAKGLYSAGFDISTSFKLTSASIMDFIESENLSLSKLDVVCSSRKLKK